MRRRTAQILSFSSERSQRDRGRLPSARAALGRLAWRVLVAAGDRGDLAAAEAVWQAWLRRVDEPRWQLLCRWRSAPAMAQAAFAAALDPARREQSRAAIGAFCSGHGLAPDAAAERALFYTLTGQHEQLRAADPDGSALAAAYQAAGDPVRAALRQAMADAGGLDLVRMVATGGVDGAGGGVAAAEGERAYLIAELARRRDWARLWRLALDFSVPEAVAAARLLPADWRPAGSAGQWLLARLAAADPARLAGLDTPPVTRIHMTGWTREVHFAPDGSEVVICYWPGSGGHAMALHALPGGEARAFSGAAGGTSGALHLGAGLVFIDRRDHRSSLIRWVRGRSAEVSGFPVSIWSAKLARAGEGFVVAIGPSLLRGTAEWGSPLRGAAVPGLADENTDRITHVAGEPASGRLAVIVNHGPDSVDDLVVLDPDLEIIGRAQIPERQVGERVLGRQVGFCGPDRVVTYEGGMNRILSWPVGPAMTAEATAAVPDHLIRRFQLLPSAGLVVISAWPANRKPGDPNFGVVREYLDVRTLRPAGCPAALDWAREESGSLELSADGRYAALSRSSGGSETEVEVRDLAGEEISELLRRPLALFRPTDLAAVLGLAGMLDPRGDHAPAEATGLLRACLEFRFATDVALGHAAAPPGADDIALADGATGAAGATRFPAW